MKRPIGDGMSLKDLQDVLIYIEKNHSFRKSMGKRVKYVYPSFDMRMGDIFHVKLRIAGEGLDFAIVNENKDRYLKEWILDWLDNGTWDSATEY